MKAARVAVLFVGFVLLLVGLLAATGQRFDVVKSCTTTDLGYHVSWTGMVIDRTTQAGVPMVGLRMYDYSDHMITPYTKATSQSDGGYFAQFDVSPLAGGRRYQVQTSKVGYDSASAFVVLPCYEDQPATIKNGAYYVLALDFALNAQTPLVAAFVYTSSYTTVDFFDRSTGGPDTWGWIFGDGSPAALTTLGSIEHVYANTGTYAVVMQVHRSTDGKIASAFANVSVSTQAPPGSPPPAPPPPPPPEGSGGAVPPSSSGSSSDVPPAETTSYSTNMTSPNGPSPVQTLESTVFSPSPLAAVLIIAGAVAILVAAVSKGS